MGRSGGMENCSGLVMHWRHLAGRRVVERRLHYLFDLYSLLSITDGGSIWILLPRACCGHGGGCGSEPRRWCLGWRVF